MVKMVSNGRVSNTYFENFKKLLRKLKPPVINVNVINVIYDPQPMNKLKVCF